MSQSTAAAQIAERDETERPDSEIAHGRNPLRFFLSLAVTAVAAVAITLAIETIARGSLAEAAGFLTDPNRPGWPTIAAIGLTLFALDAAMRRANQSVLILAPVVLVLAWVGHEKRFYLGDPLYPTDFLYARQIVELLPLMLVERPLTAMAIAVATLAGIALLALAWKWSRRLPAVSFGGRLLRLAVAVPVLFYAASMMDYARFSTVRDQLRIAPKMWDQKANYDHNGFVMAFALNLPMANVDAPAGYSQPAIVGIPQPVAAPVIPASRPDIIMVMSESFWDPLRLPGVEITPDPLDFTRSVQSGHVFSPEFGGMTSNVEFEAMTGFSNALLPYGSIPYQQYVRGEMPSLARFFKSAGYATLAMHPFQEWFWNRGPVYEAFGFEEFLSEDQMPHIKKRGKLAGDEALVDEIISQAEKATDPLFLFAVTLQNHGPYEPGRYPDSTIEVKTDAGEEAKGAIASFAQGMADSDASLERLLDWAEKRERETIVVYFGDHLPPLGPHYVSTGFMDDNVADRFAPPDEMIPQHETPLVVWSNRDGVVADIGTISPAFIPVHLLGAAGFEHPYYTGFLGRVHDRYRVVDRHMLLARDGRATTGWQKRQGAVPLLRDFRLIQYDVMFGKGYGESRFFPDAGEPLMARPAPSLEPPRLSSPL